MTPLSSGLHCSNSCSHRQVSSASSPRRLARTCAIALHVSSVPKLVSMSMPSMVGCRQWFTRVTWYRSCFKRCFVTIPSEIPGVRAYNSASAELKLTDCCVLDQAERVALPHCVTSPLVLLHDWCCLAQSLSVYTFTNGGLLLISIKRFALGTLFGYLAMRFTFISSLSVGHVIFLAVSFVLLHDVSTLVAHVQQLSHGCPVHGSLLVLHLDQCFCC